MSEESVPVFRSTVVYQDNRAALEWLAKAFGFEVSLIVDDETGTIGHAEMRFGNGIVTVAHQWSDIARSPKSVGGVNTQQIHVQLPHDIDAHCERARKAGAVIVAEPQDQFYGDRTYRCLDPEGHLWTFAQHVKTFTFDEMSANTGGKLRLRTRL